MALVLSRKENESIDIGDDVTVTVVSVSGKQVRIAINAPDNVPVHRREISDRIAKEQRRNTKTHNTLNLESA